MNESEPVSLPLRAAFASHGRQWRTFRYVYPVISRRSRGLSIGINMNPDGACNFDCVYCCVDRSGPRPTGKIDLPTIEQELRTLITMGPALFDEPEFREIEAPYRRLNDFAFSGDGEPTAVPSFLPAVQLVARLRAEAGLHAVKIVVITDACYLMRPKVVEALRVLDANNGEIWAKLDAGTEIYYRRVNRANIKLDFVIENILSAARERPIVIQSMFMRMDGVPPTPDEIAAWVARLSGLVAKGAQIKLVQVYTVARRTAEVNVTKLTPEELEAIASAARAEGFTVETFA